MNVTSIGFHGNRKARVGSEDWALALREDIRSAYSLAMLDVLMNDIRVMQENEGWRALRNKEGEPFSSLREFLTTSPIEGIGMNIEKVQNIIDGISTPQELVFNSETLGPHGGDRSGKQGYNGTLKRGNKAMYLTSRIKRDRPDIAKQMEKGKFKSAYQAGIAAGIIKPYANFRTDDATLAIRALLKHFTVVELSKALEKAR